MHLAEPLVSKRACRGGGRMTGLTDNGQRAQTREPSFHAHLGFVIFNLTAGEVFQQRHLNRVIDLANVPHDGIDIHF